MLYMLTTFAASFVEAERRMAPGFARPWLIEWTADLSAAAHAEGWDLFDCDGSLSGPSQVQKFDDPGDDEVALDEDSDAWAIVQRRDTDHARAVLLILAHHNPLEYQRILRWPEIVEGWWDPRLNNEEGGVRWEPYVNGAEHEPLSA